MLSDSVIACLFASAQIAGAHLAYYYPFILINLFADMIVYANHKLDASDNMIRHTHVHMGSNATLGSGTVPPIASVHHLPAGLPLACNLNYCYL